jgi:hypothetical protein
MIASPMKYSEIKLMEDMENLHIRHWKSQKMQKRIIKIKINRAMFYIHEYEIRLFSQIDP